MKDERRLLWGQAIERVLSGEPGLRETPSLRFRWDREAAEEVLLERWPTATLEQRRQLQILFRRWGLFEWRLDTLLWGSPWQQARAAVVLAQLQFKGALPAITTLLRSPKRDVRLAAINALGMLGEPKGREPLVEALAQRNGREGLPVLVALIRCARHSPRRLLPHLTEGPLHVRRVVAAALGELAGRTELPTLVATATDSDPEIRAQVARALGRTRDPAAFATLEQLAKDPVGSVRSEAVSALAQIRLPEVHDRLWDALRDEDWRVREKAAAALYEFIGDASYLLGRMQEEFQDGQAIESLITVLERRGAIWQAINRLCSPLPMARETSQELIAEIVRAGKFASALYAVEAHPDSAVRGEVLRLVDEHAGPSVQAPLQALLQLRILDPESRRQVKDMLRRRGGAA